MAGRKLASYVHVGGQVYGPDSDVPKEVAEQITNPRAWGEDDADASASYKSMKVDELKAEIARRNEDRDPTDLLSTDGNKADLVAALEADDSA